METVTRYDAVPLRAVTTPEGYLRDSPVIGRTGVQEYRLANGTVRREYRPPEAIFAADALAGLQGIPVVDQHPGLVTAQNVRKHQVGTVLSAGRQDGETIVADVVIHDPTPIKAGRKELSLGYTVRIDETPGVSPEGEAYDARVEAIIRYDHLAIVAKGRAGIARLRLDSSDAVSTAIELEAPVPNLVTVRLDGGLSYEAPAEVAAALTAATEARTAATRRADGLEAERDALKAQVTAAEASVAQARADAALEVRARMDLEAVATKHGVEVKADASDRALREAVVSKLRGTEARFDGKSDDYVVAAFDIAVTDAANVQQKAGEQRKAVNGGGARADAAPGGGHSAINYRAKMIADLTRNAS